MLNHNLYMYTGYHSSSPNCCRKELIQKLHNFVHLNLCIALSLGLLLFLTGIQTATANIVSNKNNPIAFTNELHYNYNHFCILEVGDNTIEHTLNTY